MTEAEWLACGAPGKMLEFLAPHGSPRKRRLFGCACCRRIWNLLPDERCRTAVEVAERFADGKATAEQLDAARLEANEAYQQFRKYIRTGDTYKGFGTGAALCVAGTDPFSSPEEPGGRLVLDWQDAAETALDGGAKWHDELAVICALIRDVFGNPFRPVTAPRAWRAADVVALARDIYTDNTFDRMPRLGTALKAAGCDDALVLDHCRGPGPHTRGCWVVDLVLNKE